MEAGAKVSIIPSDVYFKSMAQAILVSDETIQKDPELVRKLVRATLRGMKDIMNNPREAAKAYTAHVTVHQGKEASIEKVFEMYNKYVYANQKVLGTMDEPRLAELQKFYVANAIVPKEVPTADLFTNRFVLGK
jgi:NitT/TauT family transport system substrate-binding protein